MGRSGRAVCRWVLILFTLAYLAALAILAVGTFGLFGQERDPLSGIFLVRLGLPWNRLLDNAPAVFRPWLAAIAPAVNILLLAALCRLGSRIKKRQATSL